MIRSFMAHLEGGRIAPVT